jgi:hypothetical protein
MATGYGPPPPPPPRVQGTTSSFIGQWEAIYNRIVLSATYGGMAHCVAELMVVLENLAPGRRRGESYTRIGAVSRLRV